MRWVSIFLAQVCLMASGLPAQQRYSGESEGGPRFLLAAAGAGAPLRVEPHRVPMLLQRLTVRLEETTLDEALQTISARTGVRLVYSGDVVPLHKRVSLKAEEISVAAALTEVLLGANVDIVISGNNAALVRREPVPLLGTIIGRITEVETGNPVVNAQVAVDGRGRTVTDDDGRYRIADVEPGMRTVSVTSIGYRRVSREIEVGDGATVTVDFALEVSPSQLDEVVVTVTGEHRMRELGHAVGRINADSLVKEAPVSTLSELLNGRVAGLQVFQSQGSVGGEVHLQVRGPNSMLLSTEPMMIVDGVRYATRAAARPFISGPSEVEPSSPLNDLNPNDIESIEVVKGPSAATLYGTDAANGVIVVTTKRGQAGPARWSAYAKGTVSEIPAQRYPDTYWGWGQRDGAPLEFSCGLLSVAIGSCTQDSVTVVPNTLNDSEHTIFRRRPVWQSGISVSGGRPELRYFFSADFERAVGPIHMPAVLEERLKAERGVAELPAEDLDPNAFNKASFRANVTTAPAPNLELRIHTGYLHSATRALGSSGESVYRNVQSLRPNDPWGAPNTSPAVAFSQHSTERVDRFVASANGERRPAGWLLARATVGLDLGSRKRYSLQRGALNPFGLSYVGDDRVRELATTAELGGTATIRRGRLSWRTSVGAQYVRNLSDALASFGRDLPPGGTSVGEAASTGTAQSYTETVTLGSYLEETVGLNDRLFLTGALRLDGASAFGREYDAAVYPKVSASWILSEEPFLPRLPGVDELRLRYAFGASGQQALPAWALPSFSATPTVLDGTERSVIDLVALGNPHLRPERVREHELGFDATALENRLQLGVTWYRRRTVDQIVSLSLPPGLGSIYTNLGLTTQHGFELDLRASILDTRAVSWDVMFQHGLHRTNLVDLTILRCRDRS